MLDTLRSVLSFRKFETDPTKRRLARVANVADLRCISQRRLPKGVFDYVDGGAEAERTLSANLEAPSRIVFRPRVLRDVGTVDASTSLLSRPLPLPLVLAPTGFTRIVHPEGELAVARVAAASGIPYTLSTMATRSIEEVAGVSDGPKWFQVYMWRDRDLVLDMIERAAAARYEALMLTVDTPVLGRRDRDVRHGFTLPPQLGLDTILEGARHPAWTWSLVRSEPIRFANVVGRHASDGSHAVDLASLVHAQFDPTVSWSDLAWLRSAWSGPLILKGIQTVDDARIAAEHGVDAIALSNHGGRQLDDAPTPMDLIAAVAQAVSGIEIIYDGGVRRGSDIVKAVSLGATACMIGRPYLYGLAAGGERGVRQVLSMFEQDVRRTMAMVGASAIKELGPETVACVR